MKLDFGAPSKPVASPTKRKASPAKRAASPAKRVASPAKRVSSPAKRAASPIKRATPVKRKVAAKKSVENGLSVGSASKLNGVTRTMDSGTQTRLIDVYKMTVNN